MYIKTYGNNSKHGTKGGLFVKHDQSNMTASYVSTAQLLQKVQSGFKTRH